jgi:hypothetical protein
MSYEYFGSLDSSNKLSVEEVAEILKSDALTEILSVSEAALRLQWKAWPSRANWPEDIMVVLTGGGISVLFHAGNAANRQIFLHEIAAKFLQLKGVAVEFVEA